MFAMLLGAEKRYMLVVLVFIDVQLVIVATGM